MCMKMRGYKSKALTQDSLGKFQKLLVLFKILVSRICFYAPSQFAFVNVFSFYVVLPPYSEILHLQDNKLTGEVPDSLVELLNLEELLVQGNDDIEGSIPQGICELEPALVVADCHVDCECCDDNCDRN